MAVYKIFPIQDTTLYSRDQTTNAGLDEILEVGAYNFTNQVPSSTTILSELGVDDIRRSVLLFDTKDIRAAVSGVLSPVTSSLRMFLASADNLAQRYTVEAYPMAQSWENGLGKYLDAPTNTAGASWKFRSAANLGIEWSTNNGAVTSSLYSRGGGAWTIASGSKQDFTFVSEKDLNINVSNMVNSWTASFSAQQNNGIIVKLTGSIELNSGSYTGLKFYSRETHTIYPPCIELKWDDSTFVTSSTYPYVETPTSSSVSQSYQLSASIWLTSSYTTTYNQSVVTEDKFVVISNNNPGVFKDDAVHNFNFRTRDLYPVRQFTTSSVYLNWKYLPTSSYYGIQDYKTKEMVIDFDIIATKLSINPSGSNFKLYMNGLEPERSYKVLIKTDLASGETVVKDQDIIFKVIR